MAAVGAGERLADQHPLDPVHDPGHAGFRLVRLVGRDEDVLAAPLERPGPADAHRAIARKPTLHRLPGSQVGVETPAWAASFGDMGILPVVGQDVLSRSAD